MLARTLRQGLILAVTLLAVAADAQGQGAKSASVPTFEKNVLPLLSANCLKCHGASKPKAGLDLRTPAGIRQGSINGPVLVKSAADKSLLYQKVAENEMPPGKKKLSEAEVRTIRDWINTGAHSEVQDQPAAGAVGVGKGRTHWAFQPTARPQVPTVHHTDRVHTSVDAFLLARLETKGLTFSPDADRVTLLRRAYLDLLGLPPTPTEVDAFLSDDRPDAYEKMLDRLLASPHFGERWGRHWLDVVGYADTVGFDIDANLLIIPEGKWKYRDYVIEAFNRDKPYDRFVTEQLAGDELVDWRNAPRFTPAIRELLTATGYMRTARDTSHEPESNIPITYFAVLHDTVSVVGNSLLGLTVGCAQCHDHKFDPFSQKDYYRLMAAFTPAYNPKNWKPVFAWKPEVKDRGLPDVSPAEAAEVDQFNRDVERRVADLNKQRADLRRPCETRLRKAKLLSLPEPLRNDVEAALAAPPEKRNEVQRYLAGKLEGLLKVSPAEVDAALSPTDKTAVAQLDDRIKALQASRKTYGKIQALYDVGTPPSTHLLKRGNYETPGEEIHPGFINVLSDPSRPAEGSAVPTGATSGRRLALTRWLTDPDSRASGLLARVMVNRVWQHLYGQGIVVTPENFGLGGEPPTHPELLEWLSFEFAHSGGWRIKPLIKLLMTSTAYRQSSRSNLTGAAALAVDPQKVDPGNQLLWRQRLRRLEAEAIRDSILAVSGRLDLTRGGPPVRLFAQPDGMVVVDEKDLPSSSAKWRRSVYLLCRRAYNLSLLSVFDYPPVAISCPARDASAVASQSLTMLNDAFVMQQAGYFADQVAREAAGGTDEVIINVAFRRALARQPTAAEREVCASLLRRQAELFRTAKAPAADARRNALVQLCHTLLNTSEFLYAE